MIGVIATQGQLASALDIIDQGIAATTPERYEWAARFVRGDRESIIRVHRAMQPKNGRAREDRIVEMTRIIREVRASGKRPTARRVAALLGHLSEDGEISGHHKLDVRAAGGWAAILRLADG